MENISIFTKPSFFRGHLYRGSSVIRGEQTAKYLKAKYNPKKKTGICIFVKPESMDGIEDGDYVDVVDGKHLANWLQKRPKINVIACSQCSFKYLKDNLKNKIIYIPQHHCNYDNLKRVRKKVKTVGLIGHRSGFPLSVEEVKRKLKSINVDFITNFTYKDRQDVINHYKKVDVQIIWAVGDRVFKNPLKIINAASFGIPTLAPRKIAYEEMEGFYIPIKTLNDMVDEVDKLKDSKYYSKWSKKLIKEAEKYHIKNIAQLYKKL